VRLHINRRDVVANWAKLLVRAVTDEQEAWAATAGDRRKKRPRASLLNEKAHFLLDGSRTSLRKHPRPAARHRLTADQSMR
jgi:hypothetical protein